MYKKAFLLLGISLLFLQQYKTNPVPKSDPTFMFEYYYNYCGPLCNKIIAFQNECAHYLNCLRTNFEVALLKTEGQVREFLQEVAAFHSKVSQNFTNQTRTQEKEIQEEINRFRGQNNTSNILECIEDEEKEMLALYEEAREDIYEYLGNFVKKIDLFTQAAVVKRGELKKRLSVLFEMLNAVNSEDDINVMRDAMMQNQNLPDEVYEVVNEMTFAGLSTSQEAGDDIENMLACYMEQGVDIWNRVKNCEVIDSHTTPELENDSTSQRINPSEEISSQNPLVTENEQTTDWNYPEQSTTLIDSEEEHREIEELQTTTIDNFSSEPNTEKEIEEYPVIDDSKEITSIPIDSVTQPNINNYPEEKTNSSKVPNNPEDPLRIIPNDNEQQTFEREPSIPGKDVELDVEAHVEKELFDNSPDSDSRESFSGEGESQFSIQPTDIPVSGEIEPESNLHYYEKPSPGIEDSWPNFMEDFQDKKFPDYLDDNEVNLGGSEEQPIETEGLNYDKHLYRKY